VTGTLDVVIVTYGSDDTIDRCLDAVRAIDRVGDVVVVEHGPSCEAVLSSAGVRVLHDPSNPGFGAGQNRGVRSTSAPYVLLLNPDAVVDAQGIQAGLRVMESDPAVGAVQGVIVNHGSGQPERSSGGELGPVHLLGRAVGARALLRLGTVRKLARRSAVLVDHVDRVPHDVTSVETLAATAMIVRRDAFDHVGGFDESYFLYGEDLDLCRRLRGEGWRLYALPWNFAGHDNGASAKNSTERELTWWQGTMQFAGLWWSSAAWSVALVAATLAWCRVELRDPSVGRRAWRAMVSGPAAHRFRK
jgi:GT2 family glycosyltransferase